MNKIILILLISFINLTNHNVYADGLLRSNLIPNKFATFEELKKWTETSSLGGGILIELQGETATYFIADRLHTSGLATSEAIIYKKERSSYLMVYYMPFKFATRNYEIDNGKLIITEKSTDKKDKIISINENDL